MQIKDNKKLFYLQDLVNSQLLPFKKIFNVPKNSLKKTSQKQSLLFNKQTSISIIRAYQNRKKISLNEIQSRKKIIYSKQNQIKQKDSLPSKKFDLQINKCKINKDNIIDPKVYEQIIGKIQSLKINKIKLPQINHKTDSAIQKQKLNYKTSIINTYLPQNNPQSIEQFQNNNQKQFNKKTYKTLQLRQKNHSDIYQIYQTKKIKSNQKIENQKFFILHKKLVQSEENPEINLQKKQQNNCQTNGINSELKFNQLKQKPIKINEIKSQLKIQSQLKNNLSVLALEPLQKKNKLVCYMKYHPQGKIFLEQNRQNLNLIPKIKDFLITGISATSYFVIDTQTLTPIAFRKFQKKIQIASISKVMTCFLTLLACKKYNIDFKKHCTRISQNSCQIQGTSAQLIPGDILTLQQLLYGLMLPSGNDASIALAEAIGKIIQKHKKKQTKKSFYETFISHMNILSKELNLNQDWKNSSGLPKDPNYSTPKAIASLTILAMMQQNFRKIVSCQKYQITIKNDRSGLKRNIVWRNTNRLLQNNWQGVKTGTTNEAGHCLISKKDRYLIAVFNSKTVDKRFIECQQLYNFMKKKERIIFPEKWD